MLHNVYVFCLSVGVIYSAFSIFFHCFSAFDLDFDLDLETNLDIILPIKPFTVMVFLTVFGGTGLIAEKSMNFLQAFLMAFVVAYATAQFLYRYVYKALVRAQTETKGIDGAIGAEATILESIPADGFGRISYIVDDNILSGVAKRLHAEMIEDRILFDNDGRETKVVDKRYKKGEKVYILDAKDNVYYVAPTPVKMETAKSDFDN